MRPGYKVHFPGAMAWFLGGTLFHLIPTPLSTPPREGGGVPWPMNNKKSTGNYRRQRRRRKTFVGYTRIEVTVV